jgi:hypothetical protein
MEQDEIFREEDSLNRLSPEELSKFDNSIEEFIKSPEDSKNIWLLTDNIIELEDSLNDIKSSYYENFDKLILKSKSLLETAYLVCSDKTVKALIGEAITKVKECLERLGIKEEYEKYEDQKYEPYRKYGYYPEKYGYKYPYKEPKDKKEELAQDLSRDITYWNKEPIPEKYKLDLYAKEPNPEEDRFWLSVLHKIESDKQEYQQKKEELAELSKAKIELKSKEDNLNQFRELLLKKCIDNLIQTSKE